MNEVDQFIRLLKAIRAEMRLYDALNVLVPDVRVAWIKTSQNLDILCNAPGVSTVGIQGKLEHMGHTILDSLDQFFVCLATRVNRLSLEIPEKEAPTLFQAPFQNEIQKIQVGFIGQILRFVDQYDIEQIILTQIGSGRKGTIPHIGPEAIRYRVWNPLTQQLQSEPVEGAAESCRWRELSCQLSPEQRVEAEQANPFALFCPHLRQLQRSKCLSGTRRPSNENTGIQCSRSDCPRLILRGIQHRRFQLANGAIPCAFRIGIELEIASNRARNIFDQSTPRETVFRVLPPTGPHYVLNTRNKAIGLKPGLIDDLVVSPFTRLHVEVNRSKDYAVIPENSVNITAFVFQPSFQREARVLGLLEWRNSGLWLLSMVDPRAIFTADGAVLDLNDEEAKIGHQDKKIGLPHATRQVESDINRVHHNPVSCLRIIAPENPEQALFGSLDIFSRNQPLRQKSSHHSISLN
jgi:hypothetical protein